MLGSREVLTDKRSDDEKDEDSLEQECVKQLLGRLATKLVGFKCLLEEEDQVDEVDDEDDEGESEDEDEDKFDARLAIE